jgi:hypothetical protein
MVNDKKQKPKSTLVRNSFASFDVLLWHTADLMQVMLTTKWWPGAGSYNYAQETAVVDLFPSRQGRKPQG